MTELVRILLADDHALVRRGVRLVLEEDPRLKVVADASDGMEAVELARASDTDLVILDVAMPKLTGLQAAREIHRRDPDARILMLSMYDSERYFLESLRVGASGYVLKSMVDRDLLQAVHGVIRGEPFVYPAALRTLLGDYLSRVQRGEATATGPLSEREDQVVKLIAEGHTSREIARLLSISPNTVDRHRENLLAKLGLRDRTELTRYAIRNGLIEP
jgi:DNA-binding NarL/FixJ family response regulator